MRNAWFFGGFIVVAVTIVGCEQKQTGKVDDATKKATDKVADVAKGATDKVADAAKGAQDTITDAAKSAQDKVTGAAKAAQDTITDAAKTAKDKMTEAAASAGDALGEAYDSAAKQASSALESVSGGSELLTNVNGLFTSAQKSLKGVTDEASARAALPSLDDLMAKVGDVSSSTEKLPESAKAAVQKVIDSGLGTLKDLVAKVMAIPGVESVIKPKVDELMAKLDALAGKA